MGRYSEDDLLHLVWRHKRRAMKAALRHTLHMQRADWRAQRRAHRRMQRSGSSRAWRLVLIITVLIVAVHIAVAMAAIAGSVALGFFALLLLKRWTSRALDFGGRRYEIQPEPVINPQPSSVFEAAFPSQPTIPCMGPECDRPATRKSADGPWVWCEQCAGPNDPALSQAEAFAAAQPHPRMGVDEELGERSAPRAPRRQAQ